MSHASLPPMSSLSDSALHAMDAYWRAANYLSVGLIYLRDNPLLREPLRREHVKHMLLGHWGTTPGQNFIYTHLNRVIARDDLDMIYIAGPGHGGPAVVAQAYLEGTYSELYPDVTRDEAGLRQLFARFAVPGGVGSHATPACPGSIHEGGELGYSLSHAFGAVLDNPTLIAACVIGDGEAETGPLATAWHSNKFLNPAHDGAVLPILHLNGYKIASPTIFARIAHDELVQFLHGCGWAPLFVEGAEPAAMHRAMAHALDRALVAIAAQQRGTAARAARWPMIVLRSPKGWTGPERVDGVLNTGTFRAHQVPIVVPPGPDGESHLRQLEAWLASYRPHELFDANGGLRPELAALAPAGPRRMGANPHANGGLLLRDLDLPDFRRHAHRVDARGALGPGDTRVLAPWLSAVLRANVPRRNLRVFGPDETVSNGLGALFVDTSRQWAAQIRPEDDALARDGRVLEVLSEHQCQGWLEGYLLTGRHGVFNCYEAFAHIVDSMFNQHAKWLEASAMVPWRCPIASLNYLLSSHVWRQDHNGFTHQDPGFIDLVANKKPGVVRIYLPPDANCLLAVTDRCLRSRHRVNVVVAGKHPSPQWLSIDEAVRHCADGIAAWDWAGSADAAGEPDLVMACAGDVPTQETLAAVMLLRAGLPGLRVRVVNVVDLLMLQPPSQHPQGLADDAFDALFTRDRPIVFAFHGYPTLIHRLCYRRANHGNLHVHGYREEGAITTPFDMTVINGIDRFHLAIAAVDCLPGAGAAGAALVARLQARLAEHHRHIRRDGQDLDEIRGWRWTAPPGDG